MGILRADVLFLSLVNRTDFAITVDVSAFSEKAPKRWQGGGHLVQTASIFSSRPDLAHINKVYVIRALAKLPLKKKTARITHLFPSVSIPGGFSFLLWSWHNLLAEGPVAIKLTACCRNKSKENQQHKLKSEELNCGTFSPSLVCRRRSKAVLPRGLAFSARALTNSLILHFFVICSCLAFVGQRLGKYRCIEGRCFSHLGV